MEFEKYLSFLSDLSSDILMLCDLQKQKIKAIDVHDVSELNECIKKEQAASLKMRGMEQQRIKILEQLGLQGVKMQQMESKCPEEHKQKTQELVKLTTERYNEYTKIRNNVEQLLQRNMRMVETSLSNRGFVLEDDEKDIGLPTQTKQKTDIKI